MRLPEKLSGFLGYYKRFIKQTWVDVWMFWKQQVFWGVLGGAMSVFLQIELGLTARELSGRALIAFILPFLAIVTVNFIFQAIRTPWLLDKSREEEISHLNKVALTASGYVPGGQKAIEDKIKKDELHKWLFEMADKQAKKICDYVVLTEILCEKKLTEAVPYILFWFHVENKSVFTISFEKKVEGFIEFGNHHLGGQLLVGFNPQYVSPGNDCGFKLEQRLSREEAELIVASGDKDNISFFFNELFITMRGNEQFPQVEPKHLIIKKNLPANQNSVKVD